MIFVVKLQNIEFILKIFLLLGEMYIIIALLQKKP